MRALALGLLVLAGSAGAEDWPPRWWWMLPGAGQFALGRPAAGAAYVGATAGLLAWGVRAELRRGTGEFNTPLLWAQHAWVWSLYDTRRAVLLRLGQTARLDPSSVATLARAPLTPSVLLSPWVIGFAAAGWGINELTVRRTRPGWRAIGDVTYLGDRWDGRDAGIGALGAHWAVISYGAGTSEEMLFRGVLQADLEERWGTGPGWLAASALFGAAHVTHPSRRESWENGGFAALAGLWLGWRWRADGYRLAEVIAAHTWFDIAAGITAFLRDPAGNPLGAKVRFAF